MIEMGSGIALAGVSISAGGVIITALRVFGNKRNVNSPLCREHTGVMACLESIEKTGDRHEKRLEEIAKDIKVLLRERK